MTEFLARAVRRRRLLQAVLAAPAVALFRGGLPARAPMPEATPAGTPGGLDDDEIVEVGGWILKRSDVA